MTWYARTSDGTLWKNKNDAVWYSFEANTNPTNQSPNQANFAPPFAIPLGAALGEVFGAMGVVALNALAIVTLPLALSGDTRVDYKKESGNILLFRNMSTLEYDSFVRKGMNFGPTSNTIGAKEFWLDPGGLYFWQRSGLAGPYNVIVSVPQSIVGCYGIVQVRPLDGHLAGVVEPQNLNKFNMVKTVLKIYKIGK